MYIVLGQSGTLGLKMSEQLFILIDEGLWFTMGGLFGGIMVIFAIFICFFERRLRKRVTDPIRKL